MTASEILTHLKSLESESVKRILARHGAKEPFYGVKIEELKKIQKQVKKNYALSIELYNSGISDAMYLAGLIADEKQMTKEDLQQWAENASWHMISECAVAWIAAESRYGWELAMSWIDDDQERIANAGWTTLAHLLALEPNDILDMSLVRQFMQRVQESIRQAPNRVRYAMNSFMLAAACYVPELTEEALLIGRSISDVKVDMGDTACKLPSIGVYVDKLKQRGSLGKKKKTVRC